MTFVLHFHAIYDEITSTTHDGHIPESLQILIILPNISL